MILKALEGLEHNFASSACFLGQFLFQAVFQPGLQTFRTGRDCRLLPSHGHLILSFEGCMRSKMQNLLHVIKVLSLCESAIDIFVLTKSNQNSTLPEA
jgi:hypothetical protein